MENPDTQVAELTKTQYLQGFADSKVIQGITVVLRKIQRLNKDFRTLSKKEISKRVSFFCLCDGEFTELNKGGDCVRFGVKTGVK